MELGAVTDKGKVRRDNQDSCFVYSDEDTNMSLLLVCDGMGGHNAGNVASSLAATVFAGEVKEGLKNASVTGAVCSLMKGALRSANRAVFDLGRTDIQCRGMGTTVVSAVIKGEDATVMNVGDSRAYHMTGGEIRQVTRDHSVVEDMVERGDITREESRTHPNKNLITRAVGTSRDVEADFFSVSLKAGDGLMLCSDGLSNMVTDGEMLEAFESAGTAQGACDRLLELALSRGATDNVTVAILKC